MTSRIPFSPVRSLLPLVLVVTMLLVGCSSSTNPSLPASSQSPDLATPQPAVTASAEVLMSKSEVTVLDQQIAYPLDTPAQVSSAIVTLPPGAQTGWHFHSAPLYAYIIEGTLTVTYKSDEGLIEKTYVSGEAVLEAIGTTHNGENRSTDDVKILVVNMGADGIANTTAVP